MNEERKKILKMIEDGIISSEEAEDLLDSINKAEQAQKKGAASDLSTKVEWEEGDKQKSKQTHYTQSSKKDTFLNFVE
ncbi:DUF2089 domain-containing protein, partial [Escherichia coli]|uniref:DUF2089 domain-containing protein n=1 Tax=Escherichia coli TaxID=562 RepID=UPI0014135F36